MNVLTSIIGGIAFADSTARMHPRVADAIAEAGERTRGHPLPTTDAERKPFQNRSVALTTEISDICFQDTMARVSGGGCESAC